MTNSNTPQKPLYRVSFSRIKGKDNQGNDILGKPKEISTVWPIKSADKQGAILDFDIISAELGNRQGMIFLVPVAEKSNSSHAETDKLAPHTSA